jgi:hypothetical protein
LIETPRTSTNVPGAMTGSTIPAGAAKVSVAPLAP